MKKVDTIIKDREIVQQYILLVSKYRRDRTICLLSEKWGLEIVSIYQILEEQNKYFVKLNNKKIAKWKSKKAQV